MVQSLILVRHGEAAEPDPGTHDHERPLTPRGEHDAAHAGTWLAKRDVAVDRVIASPARRTRQTTTHLLQALGFPLDRVRWVDAVYNANPRMLSRIVTEEGRGAHHVLLVGHNPGIQELTRSLAGPQAPKRFAPGAIVHLRLQGDRLEPGTSTLEGHLEPGDTG